MIELAWHVFILLGLILSLVFFSDWLEVPGLLGCFLSLMIAILYLAVKIGAETLTQEEWTGGVLRGMVWFSIPWTFVALGIVDGWVHRFAISVLALRLVFMTWDFSPFYENPNLFVEIFAYLSGTVLICLNHKEGLISKVIFEKMPGWLNLPEMNGSASHYRQQDVSDEQDTPQEPGPPTVTPDIVTVVPRIAQYLLLILLIVLWVLSEMAKK